MKPNMTNLEVCEAAINLGENIVREDGGPIMVNNRKALGDISRQEIFKRVLAKGYTPEDIIPASKE